MKFFFDESGGFVSGKQIQFSIVACLICPNSVYGQLCGDFRKFLQEQFGHSNETKGSEYDIIHRFEFCEFLCQYKSQIYIIPYFVQPEHVTYEQLKKFRQVQADNIRRSKQEYLRHGGNIPAVLAYFDKLEKLSDYDSRMGDDEFLQSLLLRDTIEKALQHSVVRFRDREYEQDFEGLEFILDAKNPSKLSKMEKHIRNDLRVLWYSEAKLNPQKRFILPDTWTPDHPFVKRFSSPKGHLLASPILNNAFAFLDSAGECGLQIVDVVCNTLYRAFMDLGDRSYAQCRRLLVKLMSQEDGYHITSLKLGNEPTIMDYDKIYGKPPGNPR